VNVDDADDDTQLGEEAGVDDAGGGRDQGSDTADMDDRYGPRSGRYDLRC
jgi:hypothetical protein